MKEGGEIGKKEGDGACPLWDAALLLAEAYSAASPSTRILQSRYSKLLLTMS